MFRSICIIGFVLFLLITTFLYLIILGSNKNKNERERQIEDKEQMEYLRNYKQRKGKK